MNPRDFWQLDHLPDAQLIASLQAVLHTKRQALAELIAHLGEVEERRLHLRAAHGSMFDYCVSRLNMSEDEACRRIDLARLARKFPALFPLLANGELSLSVALLLKPVLTADHHLELLSATRGKSMRQTRELLAARFPNPDVPSSVRKLPGRQPTVMPSRRQGAASLPEQQEERRETVPAACALQPTEASQAVAAAPPPLFALTPHHPSRIEPLSAQRYKIQFTADATLKEKLELARDLMRHAHPSGDFGPVVSRALDLLIADLERRRFGAGARPKPARRPSPKGPAAQSSPEPSSRSGPAAIPRFERRTVLERDGLACSWVDADGSRCACRALARARPPPPPRQRRNL